MNILIVSYKTMLLFASKLGDGVTPELLPQNIVGLGVNNCWLHRWEKFAIGLILDYFHCEKCGNYAVGVREQDAACFSNEGPTFTVKRLG